MTTQSETQYRTFRSAVTILLGGMAGVLIALPLVGSDRPFTAGLPVVFGALGALSGYRNRYNHFFFYLCLLTICVMFALLF